MRTSNKLLLGAFFTVIFLITGIHIALYAKYKSGNYTIYHPEERPGGPEMEPLSNVRFVTIRNLYGVTVRFGSNTQIEKGRHDFVKYVQRGDTLVITSGKKDAGDMYSPDGIDLTLPFDIILSAVNSTISVEKGKESLTSNPTFLLEQSHVIFNYSKNPIQLGHVRIIAKENSIAAFQGNTRVSNLEIELANSALEYNEGDAGQLSIVTDSSSRISLQSKNILKAKVTTVPNYP